MEQRDLCMLRDQIIRESQYDYYIFQNVKQKITSKETDIISTVDKNDNTCGICAFTDICFPDKIFLLVDVGGGKSDEARNYLMNRYNFQVEVIDPFNRSIEHNMYVQELIQRRNGACMVTSMSVLNVIEDREDRLKHIVLLYRILKKNGYACFKVWRDRNKSNSITDIEKNTFQSNKHIDEYLDEIKCVFGERYVFVNEGKNLITAIKIL